MQGQCRTAVANIVGCNEEAIAAEFADIFRLRFSARYDQPHMTSVAIRRIQHRVVKRANTARRRVK